MSVVAKIALEPFVPAAPAAPPSLHRFTLEQYHMMLDIGVLSEHNRVQLLEGWIVDKMPHKPPHDGTVWLVQTVLLPHLPADWILRVQSTITTRDSEPEPDAVVARGPGSRYLESHPHPKDIALIVEVADSSLEEDRGIQSRIYARARIPVYWIVNLPEAKIEVYTQPRGGKSPTYRQHQDYGRDDTVPLVIDGREIARIAVRELLPA